MLALGIAAGLAELVRLGTVHATEVREEQQPVVRRRDIEVLDHVVGAQLGSAHALAAAVLRAVLVDAGALDVAAASERDDHVLFGNQVFHAHVAVVAGEDLRAAVVAIAVDDLGQLFDDDRTLALGLGEDVVVLVDHATELFCLVLDLLALERGQATQLQLENRTGLQLVDAQQLHQAFASLFDRGRTADECNHLIECVESGEVPAKDVHPLLCTSEAELRAPDDDLDLVRHPVGDEALDRQRARHAVDDGKHVRAEVLLQLRVLVEVVEHDLRDGVALERDDQSLTGAARGLVLEVGDALQAAVLDEVCDLARKVVGVDLVRQLGDDERRAPVDLFDVDDSAHRDRAAAGRIGILDALVSEDRRTRREVGALDALDQGCAQLFVRRFRVLEVPHRARRDLAEVVRGDVRGHSDCNADRAVDQQVRVASRQHSGLLRATVVVVLEVDRVFVDVAHHLECERRHLGLGVPGGCRFVVAGGAEVSLAVCKRVAHCPRLHETHEGVVDRRVTVRVELAHDVADDTRALRERAVGSVAAVEHRVEHAAVHGLEAVAHLRKRASDDDAHRVVEVRALHLALQVDLLHSCAGLLGCCFVSHQASLNVEEAHVACVLLNEFATSFDVFAHEDRESCVCCRGVVERHLTEGASLG